MCEFYNIIYVNQHVPRGMIFITRSKKLLSKIALFAAALIWGSSFIVVKDAVDVLSPNFLLALRFSIACIVLSICFYKRLRKISATYMWQGAIIGTLLFLAYSTQTIGITDTTPGKNAFLTAIYCVIVPFMFWAFTKKKPDGYNVLAAFLCITGIGLISITHSFMIGFGDSLTLVGGVLYAAHLVAVAIFGSDKDAILITIVQFFYAAIYSWIVTLTFESAPAQINMQAMGAVVYLALFCTAGALLLQNIGQKNTNPSAAAIILSLESVFGVMFSLVFGYEILTPKLFCGFVLIFISVIVSETKLSFLKRR